MEHNHDDIFKNIIDELFEELEELFGPPPPSANKPMKSQESVDLSQADALYVSHTGKDLPIWTISLEKGKTGEQIRLATVATLQDMLSCLFLYLHSRTEQPGAYIKSDDMRITNALNGALQAYYDYWHGIVSCSDINRTMIELMSYQSYETVDFRKIVLETVQYGQYSPFVGVRMELVDKLEAQRREKPEIASLFDHIRAEIVPILQELQMDVPACFTDTTCQVDVYLDRLPEPLFIHPMLLEV